MNLNPTGKNGKAGMQAVERCFAFGMPKLPDFVIPPELQHWSEDPAPAVDAPADWREAA